MTKLTESERASLDAEGGRWNRESMFAAVERILNSRQESAAIVESLRRQSEFYAANPRVDAQPEWDDR